MRTAAQHPPRWPKGPFPEKYRFDAVQKRLEAGWAAPSTPLAIGRLLALGLTPHPTHEDPYVRLFIAPAEGLDVAQVRAETAGSPVFAFRYALCAQDDLVTDAFGPLLGVVAAADAIDSVVAVGTAGPQHGIGTAAIVRFLATLRTFARWGLEEIGEDRLRITLRPSEDDGPQRIAERVLKICPPLTRSNVSAESLAEEIRKTGELPLSWR